MLYTEKTFECSQEGGAEMSGSSVTITGERTLCPLRSNETVLECDFDQPLINFANLEIFNFAVRRNKPSLYVEKKFIVSRVS